MPKALWIIVGLALCLPTAPAIAGGGYFSDLDSPVVQPGQEVFVHWDAKASVQRLVVQPEFRADKSAEHFGFVIPTPHRPEVKAAAPTLFSDLLAWTALSPKKCRKRRPRVKRGDPPLPDPDPPYVAPTVKVLASGAVGALEWKTIRAQDAASLYDWLKSNKYNFAADEETLQTYVRKYWVFTVVKVDSSKLPADKAGRLHGRVAPIELTFRTDAPLIPLAPVRGSARDGLDMVLYVSAPFRAASVGTVEYARKVGAKDRKRMAPGIELPRSRWDKNARTHDFSALAGYLPAGTFLTKVRTRFDRDGLQAELLLAWDKSNKEVFSFDDCGIEQGATGAAPAKADNARAAAAEPRPKADAAQSAPASKPDKKSDAGKAPASQPAAEPAQTPATQSSDFVDD